MFEIDGIKLEEQFDDDDRVNSCIDKNNDEVLCGDCESPCPVRDKTKNQLAGKMFPTVEEVLKALDRSIEDYEHGGQSESCALCDLDDKYDPKSSCGACPIPKLTSLATCRGTPFYRIFRGGGTVNMLAMKQEVSFLKYVKYCVKMGYISYS